MAQRKTLLRVAAIAVLGVTAASIAWIMLDQGGNEARHTTLSGDPASPAVGAIVDQDPLPADAADITNGLIVTRLDVAIIGDASIGQVNAALASVGGTIGSMRAGLPLMSIAVPRQDGPDALNALADTLRAQPGIRAVTLGREVAVSEAPPPPANTAAGFAYLHTTHFPAAWNARAAAGVCTNNKVTVIVADNFHRPPDALYAQFGTQVPGLTNLGTGSAQPGDLGGNHGYDVLTTLAAKLDATVPTGANPYPECLDLRALQVKGLSSFEIIFAIEAALEATSGKVVLNASFGWDSCGTLVEGSWPPCTPGNLNAPTAFERASWAAAQRASLKPFADRVLVTSSAGNEADKPVAVAYPGTGQARYGSALNVAATSDSAFSFVTDTTLWNPTPVCLESQPCLPRLTATPTEVAVLAGLLSDLGQTAGARAGNVLMVGSIGTDFNQSAFSDTGANVTAVGEGIPTLLGISTQGTSFSAPQVAGLAAYLWLVSPDLRARPVTDTVAAIVGTADAGGIINAYAATLSTDAPGDPTPTTARARLAVLDVNPDGAFNLADLQLLRDRYVDSGLLIEPSLQDYGRYDLNGDGFSGGTRPTRMDLDTTGSPRFGAPVLLEAVALVGGVQRSFNETAVSDPQVACYYANTELFSGGRLDERDALVEELCPGASGEILSGALTFTSHSGVPGVSYDVEYSITVTAEVTSDGEIVLRTITGRGSETYTYAFSAEFNCAPGRPTETKSGTINDTLGFRISDGDPLATVHISPHAFGTKVSSFCQNGSWQTSTQSDSFGLSGMLGTVIVVNGKTIAIDFSLDVTNEFGEHRVTTGQLTRRPCTLADACGLFGD